MDIQELKARIYMPDIVAKWVPLERIGDKYRGLCPFHPDKETKSLVIYDDSAYCFGCQGYWDCIDFVKAILPTDFRGAIEWLSMNYSSLPRRRYETTSKNDYIMPIPQRTINYWHSLLNNEARQYYNDRKLSSTTIEKYQLGWHGSAYVIPVWEGEPQNSLVYGVRFRQANGNGPKYWGLPGRNQPRLFNKWTLDGAKDAYIFMGEFDALLAWQDGLNAVSSTAGKHTWLASWNKLFKDVERIYVVPDTGEATAAYNIASMFIGRATVHSFPVGGPKDYTEYRQAGYSVGTFLEEIIQHSGFGL